MDARLTPNLVPLLDVLFVLLLFCMLGADYQGREQEPMLLPEAVCMKDCIRWAQPPPKTLAINVHHREERTCLPHAQGRRCEEDGHWTLSLQGNECLDPRTLAEVLLREAERRGNYGYPMSEMRMVVRSDANAPCGLAQQVVDVCSRLGFHRFEFAARRPKG